MTSVWLRAALALLFLATFCGGAGATTFRALLIGVTQYPSASGVDPLHGPVNDVGLMFDQLTRRGFKPEDIRVLADSVTRADIKAALPTHQNIMTALADLADKARADHGNDFIVIYYAGHGTRLAVTSDAGLIDNPDGFNEAILPFDIKPWDGQDVPNSIRDRDIGAALDLVRGSGAFVWAIFDSCFSDSLTRGGTGADIVRAVSPEVLGVPESVIANAVARAAKHRQSIAAAPDLRMPPHGVTVAGPVKFGKLVAFYASQSSDPSAEREFPLADDGSKQQVDGVFTYAFVKALDQSRPGASYRQLMEAIHAEFTEQREKTTPAAEGEDGGLDSAVFGSETQPAVFQWAIRRSGQSFTIPAGLVDGIEQNSVFNVFKHATDGDDMSIGEVKVTRSTFLQSIVEPVDSAAVHDLTDFNGAFARLKQRAVRLTLRIAVAGDVNGAGGDDAADQRALAAIKAVRATSGDKLGFSAEWVDPASQTGDVVLAVRYGRIWLLPRGQMNVGPAERDEQRPVPSVDGTAAPDTIVAKLVGDLGAIARTTALLRVVAILPPAASGADVDLGVTLSRSSGTASAANGWSCAAGTATGAQETYRSADLLVVRHCDKFVLTAINNGRDTIDLSPLYIDGSYGITNLGFDDSDHDKTVRLPPQTRVTLTLTFCTRQAEPNDDWCNFYLPDGSAYSTGTPLPLGDEHLLLVGSPVRDKALKLDLSWVDQPPIATRGPSDLSALALLFQHVHDAPATRAESQAPQTDITGGFIAEFNMRVEEPGRSQATQASAPTPGSSPQQQLRRLARSQFEGRR